MKKYLWFFLVCITQLVVAQSSVIVQVQVNPPFSNYLSTYINDPNKVILTLQNTSRVDLDIRLKASIEGDNGIKLYNEDGFKPPRAIHLNPNQVLRLNFSQDEIKSYIDINKIILTGIERRALIQNQALPEGSYTICVQALDYNSDQEYSIESCSAPFQINSIEVPQLLSPVCEQEMELRTPQQIIFNWTTAATMRGSTQYEFTLKEVPGRANAYDAMNSRAVPVLYRQTILNTNTLIYSAAFPQLSKGKTYVWRVQASDPSGQASFKNEGYSDVCWFKIAEDDTTSRYVFLDTHGPLDVNITPLNNNNTYQVLDENSSVYPPQQHLAQGGVICAIKNFNIGNYNVEIAKVYNCDTNHFTGYGWIYLWNNCMREQQTAFGTINISMAGCAGPRIAVNFSDIKLRSLNGGYQGIGTASAEASSNYSLNKSTYYGFISDEKDNPVTFPINIPSKNGKANWVFETITLSSSGSLSSIINKAEASVFIKWELPITSKEDMPQWFSAKYTATLNPKEKFKMNGIFGRNIVNYYEVLIPNDVIVLLKGVNIKIENEVVDMNFQVGLALPSDFHRPNTTYESYGTIESNKRVEIPFTTTNSFTYTVTLTNANDNNCFLFHNNFNIKIVPKIIGVDLSNSERLGTHYAFKEWVGIWYISADLVFPSGDWAANEIEKGTFYNTDEIKLSIDGLFSISKRGKEFNYDLKEKKYIKYYNFDRSTINMMHLEIRGKDYSYTKFNLSVMVKFIGQKLNVWHHFETDISQTYGKPENSSDKFAIVAPQNLAEHYELKMYPSDLVINSNGLNINGGLIFIDENNNPVKIPGVKFYGMVIDGKGNINTDNTLFNFDYWGVIGKIMGKEVTTTGFSIFKKSGTQITDDYYYQLSWTGYIGVGGNISASGGSAFKQSVIIKQQYSSENALTYSKVIDLPFEGSNALEFDNGLTSFKSELKQGSYNGKKCFVAELDLNLSMLSPNAKAKGKLIFGDDVQNGKAFDYWFIECGVENLFEIPIPPSDMVIYGFLGRVYSHMSSYDGINYNPDKNTSFGVYVKTNLKTSADNGKRFWGDASFEVTTNPSGGLKDITFRIEKAQIMSSGVKETDGIANGSAVVQYTNYPKKRFFVLVDVNVNAKGLLCGAGQFWLYVDDKVQHVQIGSMAEKTWFSYFCKATPDGSAYFVAHRESNNSEANKVNIGADYYFDTGKKTWLCFYGRAAVSMTADVDVAISPFQFNGNASITGEAEAGFYALGYTCEVISGSITAAVTLQFPNPVCFAGNIHGEGCIVGICKSVNFGVRYKDGSFARKSTCED